MTWIVTASGREISLEYPDPKSILLTDLVYGIGHINRFTGHAGQYTVLEHSLGCHAYAVQRGWGNDVALACLCHDLHEAIVGDVSSPVKLMVPEFKEFERRIERVVHEALGISSIMNTYKEFVREADIALLIAERDRLIPFTTPWGYESLVDVPYSGELFHYRDASVENAAFDFLTHFYYEINYV